LFVDKSRRFNTVPSIYEILSYFTTILLWARCSSVFLEASRASNSALSFHSPSRAKSSFLFVLKT
jgi:hypothetical protein